MKKKIRFDTEGKKIPESRNPESMAKNTLSYEGCNYFRQRIVLATLSGKSVKIKKIRARDDDPGLKGIHFKNKIWAFGK